MFPNFFDYNPSFFSWSGEMSKTKRISTAFKIQKNCQNCFKKKIDSAVSRKEMMTIFILTTRSYNEHFAALRTITLKKRSQETP